MIELLFAILPRLIILVMWCLYGLGEMNANYDRIMEEHLIKSKKGK